MINISDRESFSMTVLSGPDVGMRRTFRKGRVSIGRGGTNDFSLSDGFVSNFHGEIVMEPDHVLYRDLKSRHGSLVCVDNVSFHLHNKQDATSIKLQDSSEIQLGCTLIRLELEQPERASTVSATSTVIDSNEVNSPMRETLITASHQPVPTLTRQLDGSDKRIGIIFRLAGILNGLTQLDEILEHIIDATFDAFPAANFFALTLMPEGGSIEEAEPFVTRKRRFPDDQDQEEEREGRNETIPTFDADEVQGGLSHNSEPADEEQAPIIPKSILRQAVESGDSVLFVRDSLGTEISQSIIDAKITACLCAPLIGQRSLLGVVEVDTRGQGSLFSKKDLELFNIVASLAAFALERANLTQNIVEMFESFVHASVNAIEARDPTTAGHSERVALYTIELAEAVNQTEVGFAASLSFTPDEMTELRYAALLHDFGKIAVREDVLQKAKRLPEVHLDLVSQRFETIKALAYREHVEEPLFASIARGETLTTHQYEELRGRHAAFCSRLDEQLSWLQEIAAAGWLNQETVDRVRELGARSYIDAHGAGRPYLTPFEIENLTIRRGNLNEQEWENMRSHAAFSQDYLERIPWGAELQRVPCIAGSHHEKLDGSGYPLGLTAEALLPQVRMLTIADIFDALTASDRPYRKAATIERACSILDEEAKEKKLDLDLVGLFKELVIPRILRHVPSLKGQAKA